VRQSFSEVLGARQTRLSFPEKRKEQELKVGDSSVPCRRRLNSTVTRKSFFLEKVHRKPMGGQFVAKSILLKSIGVYRPPHWGVTEKHQTNKKLWPTREWGETIGSHNRYEKGKKHWPNGVNNGVGTGDGEMRRAWSPVGPAWMDSNAWGERRVAWAGVEKFWQDKRKKRSHLRVAKNPGKVLQTS